MEENKKILQENWSNWSIILYFIQFQMFRVKWPGEQEVNTGALNTVTSQRNSATWCLLCVSNLSAKTLKAKTTTTLYGSASAPSRRSYKGSWHRTGPAVSPTVSHMLQSSMLCHPCSLIFPGISRSINVTKRLAAKRCSYTDMLKRNRAFLSKADLEPPRPSPGNPPITQWIKKGSMYCTCMRSTLNTLL